MKINTAIIRFVYEFVPRKKFGGQMALVNFLYFKIVTQFCHAQYREDGEVRIRALIDDILNYRFLNNAGLANASAVR